MAAQQPEAHLAGRVLDHDKRLPLEQALMRLRETKVEVESDSAGYFHLPLPPGRALTLEVWRGGYYPQQLDLRATTTSETLKVTIVMVANPFALPAVVVEDEHLRPVEPLQTSQSAEVAMRRPGAFEDPLRSLQQMPGVTLRSDFDSQLSVRGATPDQNLVMVDGFALPNPYRLQFAMGGGMSLINLGILHRANLWKSGFSPRYGDRLAGLVLFETKSTLDEKSCELRLNVFDASLNLALPLPQHRAGFLLTMRRNYHDALAKLAPANDFAVPRWQDIQLKATYQVASRHQIEMLSIAAKEWTDLSLGGLSEDRIRERSSTVFAGLVHRWMVAGQTKWENYLSHFQGPTRLRYLREQDSVLVRLQETALADYHFDDRTWQWRSEITWWSGARVQWLTGLEVMWQRQWADLRFSSWNADSPLVLPENYRGQRWRRVVGAFVDYRYTLSEALVLEPGLRIAGQNLNENLNAEPRLTIAGETRRFNYRLHWGLYYQTVDWQSLFRREWPMDIRNWQTMPNERAALYSADFSVALNKHLRLAAGIYGRTMNPFIVPIDESEGAILEFRNNDLGVSEAAELMANRPRVTRGRQNGVELASLYSATHWQVDLRYTYSRSFMRDLDDTAWIAAATDRPHDVAVDLNRSFGTRLKLGSFFRYTSGNPHTPVVAIWRDINHRRFPSGYRFIYAPRNSERFPEYLRLDLRGTFSAVIWGASVQFYLEWLNVTNHRNLYQTLWTSEKQKTAEPDQEKPEERLLLQPIYMLPRLVVGGIAVRF